MNLAKIWAFIAGDSRLAPIAVALAIIAAVLVHRSLPGNAVIAEVTFVGIVGLGLIAGVFEKL